MRHPRVLVLLAVSVVALTRADGGHEIPIYPSYYPHEIRIETHTPASAARLLPEGKLQAYLGEIPAFRGRPLETAGSVESLGSYLVLTLDRASPAFDDEAARCAAMGAIVQALDRAAPGFTFHPYPVTPYHMDYLHHADLAEAAKARLLSETGRPLEGSPVLKVRAEGELAQALVPPPWRAGPDGGDARLEEIDAGALVASQMIALNGWLGPPWVKEGWFHASLLLGETIAEPTAREEVADAVARLHRGDSQDAAARLNLERELVRRLTRGCERWVVGYTLRRWYFNREYSAGVENLAYDSHTGFYSPLFLRTVKLKDFPWNGWLRLGIETAPTAAWNPVAGFTDPAGRLIWFAVGDPAALPAPYGAGWVLNRIADVRSSREE